MSSLTEQQKNEVRQIFDEQLERFIKYQLRAFQPPETAPKPQQTQNILQKFSAEQEAKLTAEVKGNYWIIKPKQFLGTELFASISAVVRGLHGEYISAGKDSHWRVPT